ncbi:MAG: sugar ABC transporter permease [Anaerolineales bacterium]|nr:sugar ABC transporter permease [Anaerolineales bacterium]
MTWRKRYENERSLHYFAVQYRAASMRRVNVQLQADRRSEILDAAHMDGAGRLRRFLSITIPLISPAVFFTLVLNLTAAFGGSLIMDRGFFIDFSTSSYDSYIHSVLFRRFAVGEAASLAWVFFIFVILMVLALFGTSKKWVYFPDQEG